MNLTLDLPTPAELNRRGFQALTKELGLAAAIRYVQQFDHGQGDYTTERQQWADSVSLEDIEKGIAPAPASIGI